MNLGFVKPPMEARNVADVPALWARLVSRGPGHTILQSHNCQAPRVSKYRRC